MTGYMKCIFPIFTGWNFIINYFHCDVYQITLTHSPTEFKLKLKIKLNLFGIFSSYFEKKLFHISFPELQEKSEALDCKMLYCKPNIKSLSKYKFIYSGNCNNKNCSRSQISKKYFKKLWSHSLHVVTFSSWKFLYCSKSDKWVHSGEGWKPNTKRSD